jgi:hypothetical protein
VDITPFKAFSLYIAIKTHFTVQSYDVFRYNGQVRCSYESFIERNDSKLFDHLANKYPRAQEFVRYLVSNFAYSNPDVVYTPEKSEKNLKEWTRRKDSLSYLFRSDLDTIADYIQKEKPVTFNETVADLFPIWFENLILELFVHNKIYLETVCILMHLSPGLKFDSNAIYDDWVMRINKTKYFVQPNKDKCSEYLQEFKNQIKKFT